MRMAVPQAATVFAPPARRPAIQMKTRIGPVDDPLEHEADRIADAVVSGRTVGTISDVPADTAQRKCAECEEEEKSVQRKCEGCSAEHVPGGSAEMAADAVSRGGAPLTPEQRMYFEPRFGRDFSAVRVHTDGTAKHAARAINARAYTLGSNIAFNSGEYDGVSSNGQQLLAHELAHVVQQSGAPAARVQRTVAGTSNCAAGSSPNAPAVPLNDLQTADAEAQRMALGASNVLDLEALTFRDPTFGPSYVSAAYRSRFGPPPPAPNNRFRNRFTGAILNTEPEAAAGEMRFLSTRFRTAA